MKTLIKSNKLDPWYPIQIQEYSRFLKLDESVKSSSVVKKNITYNLQYLEYIEKQLEELNLSNVLERMLYKTYIIVAMGIIESLFANLLKSKKMWRLSEWKSIGILISNESKVENKFLKVNTELFQRVEVFDERMDFDAMIKKIESKNLLNIDHHIYPALKILRDLRNKVHLQGGKEYYDTDYNSFNKNNKKMMGRVLYTILMTDEFCQDKVECSNYEILQKNFN